MPFVLHHSIDGYFGPFDDQATALTWAFNRAELAHDDRPAAVAALSYQAYVTRSVYNPDLVLQGPTQWSLDVAREAVAERFRQDVKWGFQHLPDLTPTVTLSGHHGALPVLRHTVDGFAHLAQTYRRHNNRVLESGAPLDWASVLLEEVFEALSAGALEDRRAELVQVAAVAFAQVEDIDSRPTTQKAA
jgi:hypothetical protein